MLSAKLRLRLPPALAILAGLTMLAFVGIFPTRLAMIQTAAGLAALIVGLMALEREGKLPRLPILRRLGDWSYAMYLVHVPVILGTFKLLGGSPTWLMLTISAVSVLLVSAAVGQLDLATYYRLKTVVDRAPRVVLAGFAIAFLAMFLAAAFWGLRQR